MGSADTDDRLDAEMLARADSYRDGTKVNTRPYASTLGDFDVNCFVQGDVASFSRVHPDASGSGVKVTPGTVIVREVLDASGHTAKLTIMAKGPPGFDPTLGDWWFGVTDPSGHPLADNGSLLIGRLQQCHDCHLERAHDDFLFGVRSGD